jgi:hypothetical protein
MDEMNCSRVAATTTVSQVTDEYVEDGRMHILQDKDIPYATIFRIHGPFLFDAGQSSPKTCTSCPQWSSCVCAI